MPFWYRWSSWCVELAGGGGLGFGLTLASGSALISIVAGTAVSILYEFLYDANGDNADHRPWSDIGQREVGIVVGAILGAIL